MITLTTHQQKTLERIGVEMPADQTTQQLLDEIVHRVVRLELDRDRWRLRVYAVADLIREIRGHSDARPIRALADAMERAIR